MHIAIVGAGIGGLAAAALLTPYASVTLYERTGQVGGRGRAEEAAGAMLNLGPHALYTSSAGLPILRKLGVEPTGGVPPTGGKLVRAGRLHDLPGAPSTLWSTEALTMGEKFALPRWLGPWGAPDIPLASWLSTAQPGVADFVRAMVRVSSYTNAPSIQSAKAAMRQVGLALRGVRYVDGGWQQIVDGLRRPEVETKLGHEVSTLPDADAVILTVPPAVARKMGVPVPELVPVRAACLDLVLDGLPNPENRFVLGLDAPVYLSEHGSIARLGGTVIHVARYLAPENRGGDALGELEALLDLAQPGWRSRVVHRRFLPELTVTWRVDRPGERVASAHLVDGRPVHLVGDWVGEVGMLVDRSLASAAEAAAQLIARQCAAA